MTRPLLERTLPWLLGLAVLLIVATLVTMVLLQTPWQSLAFLDPRLDMLRLVVLGLGAAAQVFGLVVLVSMWRMLLPTGETP